MAKRFLLQAGVGAGTSKVSSNLEKHHVPATARYMQSGDDMLQNSRHNVFILCNRRDVIDTLLFVNKVSSNTKERITS